MRPAKSSHRSRKENFQGIDSQIRCEIRREKYMPAFWEYLPDFYMRSNLASVTTCRCAMLVSVYARHARSSIPIVV